MSVLALAAVAECGCERGLITGNGLVREVAATNELGTLINKWLSDGLALRAIDTQNITWCCPQHPEDEAQR